MMVRRTSSSKMYHTLTVEAPITKVIHILMSVRESSPLYIAQALDKVKSTLLSSFFVIRDAQFFSSLRTSLFDVSGP